jgi:hypothetical protein
MKKVIAISVLVIFFQGCATTYQSVGYTGGYSETQLDENVFKVSFYGNQYAGRERVTDFTLLRSAELTLKHGYKYFVIIDSNNFSKNSTHRTPTTYYTTGSAYSYGNTISGRATTTTSGGQTYNVSKPGSSNTIICYKEKPEKVFSYNAKYIYKNITQKYDIQNPGNLSDQIGTNTH